jgi:hypothetical protein
MMSNAALTPVLPVVDVSRATDFYRVRLGLKEPVTTRAAITC